MLKKYKNTHFFASNSFQKYIFVLKGSVYNIQLMLKYHAVGKYENLKGLDETIQSCIVCTFWCVLSDSPQNAVMWGCEITQGCSTASPSPTRRGQPSPERCAPPSPPTYASSSPCHSSLAMYMGRLCSLRATTKSSKVRAAISRTLCSSILYLFINSSL